MIYGAENFISLLTHFLFFPNIFQPIRTSENVRVLPKCSDTDGARVPRFCSTGEGEYKYLPRHTLLSEGEPAPQKTRVFQAPLDIIPVSSFN